MSNLIFSPVALKSGTGLKRLVMRFMPPHLRQAKMHRALNHSDRPFLAAAADFYHVCCKIIVAQIKNFVIKPAV
jgi:hypothetical protein